MLTDQRVRDLLAAFSAPDPTPGGGSASALASATGASLLLMVSGLPKTRSGSDADRLALAASAAALDPLRRDLTDAVDADAAAYDQVVAAFKLPRNGDQEQRARRQGIEQATIAATEVPLSVMRLSVAALAVAKTVAAHGNRSAASDVGVAIALLRAGLHGACLNVDVNLSVLKDHPMLESLRADAARLAAEGSRAAAEADASLGLVTGR
jgi:formiminotetrahydrofolate cyclodeaminase